MLPLESDRVRKASGGRAHQGQRWLRASGRESRVQPVPTVTLQPRAPFAWVVGERTGDERWFVARSDGRAIWSDELTVSR